MVVLSMLMMAVMSVMSVMSVMIFLATLMHRQTRESVVAPRHLEPVVSGDVAVDGVRIAFVFSMLRCILLV